MAEVLIGNRIYRHATKPELAENVPGKVVEAFGLGKCPKLAKQVRSDILEVRVNTLRVLCDEFRNPASIAGVVKCGLMRTLPEMVLDSDLETRKYASKAMVAAAREYNGRMALLEAGAPATIFCALDDDNVDVRRSVYETLANASNAGPGTCALVQARYPAKLVDRAVNEVPELQPLALKVLCNLIKERSGLEAALEASLVQALIGLLREGRPRNVQREASVTVALACFDDVAKITAIQNDGVAMLAALLSAPGCDVRSAAMGALMVITTVDAGKRAILSTSAAEDVVKTLTEKDEILLLNALKLIASIAAHPDIRSELREDKACLRAIQELQGNSDPMIAKHAPIALKAVLWEP